MRTKRSDNTERIYTEIKIKLLPRSSKNQIVGKEGDVYKVKVTSPPVDGKANRSLISLFSKRLRRPKRDIEIIAGNSSRIKLVRINGLSREDIAKLMVGD